MSRNYNILSNVLLLSFALFCFQQGFSIEKRKIKKQKIKNEITEDTARYKIHLDTVINGNNIEIHADTIFNKKYEFKKIIKNSETIADTTWQTKDVYSVNFKK